MIDNQRRPLLNRMIFVLVYFMVGFISIYGCKNNKQVKTDSERRIISLAPHITEIIYALKAQDQLVAVSDFCRYPKDALTKEKIGGLLNPNIEKMVTLKPTHLFGLPSHEKLSQELEKFGLTVTMMSNETIWEVEMSITKIGEIIDRVDEANQLIAEMNQKLDSLQETKMQKNIKAVLMIGREKGTLRNITAAGGDTYFDELWNLVGGVNCYTDLPAKYGTISLESLILRDPDVIIEFDMQRKRGVYREELSSEWEYLNNLDAVKKGNIYVIGGNHTMIPGPRLVLLAVDFRKIINAVEKRNAMH